MLRGEGRGRAWGWYLFVFLWLFFCFLEVGGRNGIFYLKFVGKV